MEVDVEGGLLLDDETPPPESDDFGISETAVRSEVFLRHLVQICVLRWAQLNE